MPKSIQFEPVSANVQYSLFLVSYIDIMGQGRVLERVGSLGMPQDAAGLSELRRVFAKALRDMTFVRDSFKTFVASMSDERPVPAGLPSEVAEHYGEFRHVDIRQRPFSDSLLMTSRLAGSERFGSWCPINTIWVHLFGLAAMFMTALANRIPLRGGIALGYGIEIDGEYVGPALQRAYHLEHKVAKSPRVAVSRELRQLLQASRVDHPNALLAEGIRKYAERAANLLYADSDGVDTLDFLSPAVKELGAPFGLDAFAAGRRFAESSAREFGDRGDRYITSKYEDLLAYYQLREGAWLEK